MKDIEIQRVKENIQCLSKSLEFIDAKLKSLEFSKDCNTKAYVKKYRTYSACILSSLDENGENHRKYISLKSPAAKKLVNYSYLKRIRPKIVAEIEALNRFLRDYKPWEKCDVYNYYLPDAEAMINPLFLDCKSMAERWMAEDFKSNAGNFSENKIYPTKNGDYVRSKSELIIADLLFELEIPYKYECMYKCNGEIYFPDFTIFNRRTGDIFYLEFFGMMENSEYCNHALKKISDYQRGSDSDFFVYIFESSQCSIDIENLRKLFMRKFL